MPSISKIKIITLFEEESDEEQENKKEDDQEAQVSWSLDTE